MAKKSRMGGDPLSEQKDRARIAGQLEEALITSEAKETGEPAPQPGRRARAIRAEAGKPKTVTLEAAQYEGVLAELQDLKEQNQALAAERDQLQTAAARLQEKEAELTFLKQRFAYFEDKIRILEAHLSKLGTK
jgi:FtsZ-binding cell division protein ZapB